MQNRAANFQKVRTRSSSEDESNFADDLESVNSFDIEFAIEEVKDLDKMANKKGYQEKLYRIVELTQFSKALMKQIDEW